MQIQSCHRSKGSREGHLQEKWDNILIGDVSPEFGSEVFVGDMLTMKAEVAAGLKETT